MIVRTSGHTVLLLGAGGHANSVADVLERAGDTVLGRVSGDQGNLAGIELAIKGNAEVLVAIGDNRIRQEVIEEVPVGLHAPALFAVTATVSVNACVSPMSVAMEHSHVGPGAHVGIGVIVNTGAVVEHDCFVGDAVHFAPSSTVLGGCIVEDRVLVGAGSVVLPGVKIGADAIIGAGAVVRQDVGRNQTVAGVPAKRVGM